MLEFRIWDAMLEWLGQFRDVSQRLVKQQIDVMQLLEQVILQTRVQSSPRGSTPMEG